MYAHPIRAWAREIVQIRTKFNQRCSFKNMSEREKSNWSWPIGFWSFAILVFIIGLVAAVAVPNFVGSRRSGPGWDANGCINNLRQIDAAANQFALEHHPTNGDRINFPSDLTPYIKPDREGRIASCPDGGVYHLSRVGETPTCSVGNTVTPGHYLP